MRGLRTTSICLALVAMPAWAVEMGDGAGPESWAGDLTPIPAADWSYARAGHLLERAGFGGTPEEIERLAAMSPREAVEYLVNYEAIDDGGLSDYDESNIWDGAMIADADQHLQFGEALRKAYRTGEVYGRTPSESETRPYQEIINTLYTKYFTSNREWRRAAVWWANRMLISPRPLEEKMTLVWHGHFATEEQKLDDYRLMLHQNWTLRRLATGNFRDLLIAVAQDPAMLVYLDNRINVKGQPNENFAREILELFGLGIGNYSEYDIKEAARAFTGWRNEGLRFINDPALHDDTDKTVFGQTGNFDGYAVIDLILQQPACAEFISRKLYRYFVREELSSELNTRLAELLREHNYEFKPFLAAILASRDFYSAPSYATQIKGPVQYMVSSCRKLGLERIPGTPFFTSAMANLGQSLGDPPNVKGWDGGRTWINPSTLLQRGNIMRHLLFPEEAAGVYPRYEIPDRYKNAEAEADERDMLAAEGYAAEMDGADAMMSEGGTMAEGGMMAAPAAKLINSAPDYDLKVGVYSAIIRSFERVKPVPPTPAQLSIAAMIRASGATTPEEAVRYLEGRFLRVPLSDGDRTALVTFATTRCGETIDYSSKTIEIDLRELLHAIMSTPEFQLA